MFTKVTFKFGSHSALILQTSLQSLKKSHQDLIAHFVYSEGLYEKKVNFECEGPWKHEIDEQISNHLPTWIANFRFSYQPEPAE